MGPLCRLEKKHGVVERTPESGPKSWAGVPPSKVSVFLLGHFLRLQNGAETLALPDTEKLGEPEEALEMDALWKMTSCVHFLKASFLLTGRFWTG